MISVISAWYNDIQVTDEPKGRHCSERIFRKYSHPVVASQMRDQGAMTMLVSPRHPAVASLLPQCQYAYAQMKAFVLTPTVNSAIVLITELRCIRTALQLIQPPTGTEQQFSVLQATIEEVDHIVRHWVTETQTEDIGLLRTAYTLMLQAQNAAYQLHLMNN
jgi:hypothetical protein